MPSKKHIHGDMPHIPRAVSRHMARLARLANAKMRGTAMAKRRSAKALKARWRKRGRACQKCQGTGEIHWNDGTLPPCYYRGVKCSRCAGTGKITTKTNHS